VVSALQRPGWVEDAKLRARSPTACGTARRRGDLHPAPRHGHGHGLQGAAGTRLLAGWAAVRVRRRWGPAMSRPMIADPTRRIPRASCGRNAAGRPDFSDLSIQVHAAVDQRRDPGSERVDGRPRASRRRYLPDLSRPRLISSRVQPQSESIGVLEEAWNSASRVRERRFESKGQAPPHGETAGKSIGAGTRSNRRRSRIEHDFGID